MWSGSSLLVVVPSHSSSFHPQSSLTSSSSSPSSQRLLTRLVCPNFRQPLGAAPSSSMEPSTTPPNDHAHQTAPPPEARAASRPRPMQTRRPSCSSSLPARRVASFLGSATRPPSVLGTLPRGHVHSDSSTGPRGKEGPERLVPSGQARVGPLP